MRTLFAALCLISTQVFAGPIDQAAALESLQLPGAILLDVRTPEEVAQGHLDKALNLPLASLREHIGHVVPDKNTPVILYCRSGRRSSEAQDALQALGYQHVINAGGYQQLKQSLPSAP